MPLTVLTAPPSSLLTTLATIKDELNITATTYDDALFRMLQRASSAIARELGRSYNGWSLLGVGQYQETLQGSGSQRLGLSCVPVLSVTQVLRDDEVLPAWSPNANLDDSYQIDDAEAGTLYNPAGWGATVALLGWGSEAYSSRYILPGGSSTLRYTVTYTAGYFLPVQEQDPLQDLASGTDPLADASGGVVLDTTIPPTVPNDPPVLNTPTSASDAPPLPGAIEQACLVTVKSWWFSRMRDITVQSQKSEEQQVTYTVALMTKSLPAEALGLLRNYRRVA